ncbi:phosphotransferase [Thiosocius teredinicola]|uniref:phosphotransferase n=1 Tax=Thiosocius teredinicola TaxID=1973002 RepID=UPI000990CDC4
MRLPASIRENLRFLCVEVDSQVGYLQNYLLEPSAAVGKRVLDRGGYAYNLKMRIQSSCADQLASQKPNDSDPLALRSIEFIATKLDQIAALCRDCIRQLRDVEGLNRIAPKAYVSMLQRVRQGMEWIEPAIVENDTRRALKIGELESKLDRDYAKLMKRHIAGLKRKGNTEDLTHGLLAAHCIEQMGDALLEMGEAVLSVNLGQPVNLERFRSMQATVEKLDVAEDISEVQIKTIAQTRSGSAIAGIASSHRKSDGYVGIFKDGHKGKLKEERAGVESWHEIYPGLAPKILSYKKRGQSAALLIEHLPGLTIEQILLHESPKLLAESLKRLGKTLNSVWRETHTEQPVSAGFMHQLECRLDDVYRIHPEFREDNSRICGLEVPGFDSLVRQANDYEVAFAAPFSVYIHGDFNVDNIIYDPIEKRINFIDLHRSRYMDYVQDVSVFMVSNYRLQVLDAPLRDRILMSARDFYGMARRYAKQRGDETFDLRLALGLARSFATSTRFILDESLAQGMFLRARYLLERVLATPPHKAARFRTPVKEVFVG